MVRFFDLTIEAHSTKTTATKNASTYLRDNPPKLIVGNLSKSQHEWLTHIRLQQHRQWLRKHTSCKTIICPIEAGGETKALLARIEGKAKTGLTVTMDVSDMTKIKLAKCLPAWQWQVEIAETVVADFVAEALNTNSATIDGEP
jgi:hypothetical protein